MNIKTLVVFLFIFLPASYSQENVSSKLLDTKIKLLEKKVCESILAANAIKNFTLKRLIAHCNNPVFVEEVKKQNDKKISLEEIKKIDKQWLKTNKSDSFKKALLKTPCSIELNSIKKKNKAVLEAFVMDNQGALVGLTNITSDYWQGDEDKWSITTGKEEGMVHVNVAQFDKSVNDVLQQISLPIIDNEGKVIGAVTWGLALNKIDWNE